MPSVKHLFLIVLSFLFLAACGGGSGTSLNPGISNPAPPPPPPPPEEEEPASPPEEKEPASPPEEEEPNEPEHEPELLFDAAAGLQGFTNFSINIFDENGDRVEETGVQNGPPNGGTLIEYVPATDTLSFTFDTFADPEFAASFALDDADIVEAESTDTFRVYAPADDAHPVDKAIVLKTGDPQFNLTHLTLGAWVATNLPDDSNYDTMEGAFILGRPTDDAALPVTGTASYSSVVLGAGKDAFDPLDRTEWFTFEGLMTAMVDFGAATVDTSFFDLVATTLGTGEQFNMPGFDVPATMLADGRNGFKGFTQVTGDMGGRVSIDGAFFGPSDTAPAEIGGVGLGNFDVAAEGAVDIKLIHFAFGGTRN